MEDYNGYETVKERLIIAGISELQKHSVEDLSLRKVSASCNVSCAAPYKHFQSKEDFLAEIVKYVNCQWTKLRSQIMDIFKDDEKQQVIEVCIAYIKFCMANPNFRNIMVMKTEDSEEENFYFSEEDNLIRKYCMNRFKDKDTVEEKVYTIHCLVYGTTYMIDNDQIDNSKDTIDKVRKILEKELQ